MAARSCLGVYKTTTIIGIISEFNLRQLRMVSHYRRVLKLNIMAKNIFIWDKSLTVIIILFNSQKKSKQN